MLATATVQMINAATDTNVGFVSVMFIWVAMGNTSPSYYGPVNYHTAKFIHFITLILLTV